MMNAKCFSVVVFSLIEALNMAVCDGSERLERPKLAQRTKF